MSTSARLTLSSPEDLLTAMPFLLGYHPADALAFTGFADGRLIVSGCCNVQALVDTNAADGLVTLLRERGCSNLAVIGYGRATTVTAAIDAVRAACAARGVAMQEALRVSDGRYWSYVCPGPDCCPAEGTPIPPPDTPLAATLTAAGMTALPDRAAMDARLDPAPGNDLDTITTIIAAADISSETPSKAQTLLRQHTMNQANTFPDVAETGIILARLRQDDDFINAALDHIDHSEPGTQVALWTWLTRHAPSGYRAEPASILAYASWRAGDGVLARIACERALTDAPHYRLAQIITELLDTAADPTSVPPIVAFRQTYNPGIAA